MPSLATRGSYWVRSFVAVFTQGLDVWFSKYPYPSVIAPLSSAWPAGAAAVPVGNAAAAPMADGSPATPSITSCGEYPSVAAVVTNRPTNGGMAASTTTLAPDACRAATWVVRPAM